ncbi:MAG: DUF2851 family protein [Bacteroidia bacterium]|nr:DUF2851 family protein [Bacteroidia bacterium]
MKEELLHFIWKTLNFEFRQLRTIDGDVVHLIHQGFLNFDQGPDFSHARLRIGYLDWNGQVEIHLKTGDWYAHGHQNDPLYNGVVLHVVWESDGVGIIRQDGTRIPEIELKGRVPPALLHAFDRLWLSQDHFPCKSQLKKVSFLRKLHWIERVGVERMEEKAQQFLDRLSGTVTDWEQVLWEEIAAAMGGTANRDAFRALAQNMPLRILRKYARQLPALEALLFGMSGMLAGQKGQDDYFRELKFQWEFLSQKHDLHPVPWPIRFLRMRPVSFPTLRLSQLALILHRFPALSELMLADHIDRLLHTPIHASSYWETHYRFFKESPYLPKTLGHDVKISILINTLIPLAWLYYRAHGRDDGGEMIANRLEKLPGENNKITAELKQHGFPAENALHTQGMIGLKKDWCNARRCIDCGIGQALIAPKSLEPEEVF